MELELICFDTSIVDLTDQLADPVEVLFGVQLGGGTDINSALAYCEKQVENPMKTHLVHITDLYEGGDAKAMLARAAAIKQSGVNLIALLALSDSGHPAYEAKHAEGIASLGCPVFACTPDQFPSMMGFRAHRKRPKNLGGRRRHCSHSGILSGTVELRLVLSLGSVLTCREEANA
jgi:hypothetical protein